MKLIPERHFVLPRSRRRQGEDACLRSHAQNRARSSLVSHDERCARASERRPDPKVGVEFEFRPSERGIDGQFAWLGLEQASTDNVDGAVAASKEIDKVVRSDRVAEFDAHGRRAASMGQSHGRAH